MTTLIYPRVHASDALYTSGSANGLETKTDPGAALTAQGIVPGTAGAQHINHTLHAHSMAARYAIEQHLLSWAPITHDDAPPTTAGLAAVASNTASGFFPGALPLLCKGGTNGTHIISDDLRGDTEANAGTVTTVRDAAYNPVGERVV